MSPVPFVPTLFSFLLFAVDMLAISGYLLSIDQPTDGAPDMADKEDDAPDLTVIAGGKDTLGNVDETKPIRDGVKNREGLTNKQRAFVKAMLAGAASQSAAYKASYSADNMSAKAICTEAGLLMQHPVIAKALEVGFAARDAHTLHSAASRRAYISENLLEMTAVTFPDATRLRALEMLGKSAETAYFSDKIEITNVDGMTEEQVTTELEAQLKRAFNE